MRGIIPDLSAGVPGLDKALVEPLTAVRSP